MAGREISFLLPFREKTKGEMVRWLATGGLQQLARCTVSCVHYPLRTRSSKQCGTCAACIFRRQAMMVAGIEEPNVYEHDIFGPVQEGNRVPERRLNYLKAFLLQVANLGPLEGDRVDERLRRHLYATHLVSDDEALVPFLRLFSRYRDEWLTMVADGMKRGSAWAGLLAPIGAHLIGKERHVSY